MNYPTVNSKQNFAELEEELLQFWQKENIFEQSLAKNNVPNTQHYVFYDGPPFANGLPHYGHLLTGYVKDLIPRYQTMKGKLVNRKFGWDCHGLPAEMDAQKHLNVNGRKEIIELGIEKFNQYCQTAVLKYSQEWETYVNRQARWVDFKNGYKTMDTNFMESVLWAFAELYKKGLIYEGNRVMPYSWALETPLSNFETRLDNSYRNRQDPALSVAFELTPLPDEKSPLKIIAWTTTPWTLPSNLALAVGENIEYLLIEKEKTQYIIGQAAFAKYSQQLEGAVVVKTILGKELAGRKYKSLFPYFKNTANAFQILLGDFVSTEDGTGIVHLAPAFGEEDQLLCAKHQIEPICPIDSQAKFTSEVPDYQGIQVFEANKLIIADLKKAGVVIKHETIDHNYPHCWRTDTPLIYKVQKSWYVKVTDFKDRMVNLNQSINWIPGHVKDGSFGNWLEGAKDWSISRNRFFGTPIPIWKSDDANYPRIDVYGSLAEIQSDFGVELKDLHRPYIDELTRPNPDDPTGKSTMRRIADVFDCWFESGSMPFAQLHYPFENKELFQNNFPADFIVEYVAQTRGWFYTMMILSTALFDQPPFKNAICHGVINDEDGEKLSKSKRNYPDPIAVFNTQGSDTLRWYLMSSPLIKGGNLSIDKDGKGIAEAARKMLIPLWNAYSFFCLYANTEKAKAKTIQQANAILDQYILAKTAELTQLVSTAMDQYDIPKATTHFEHFIEVLNNWYIRRSRERFWRIEKDQDKQDAYDTLYTVLITVAKLIAPFLPYLSEAIYKGLTQEKSVHLANYPQVNELPLNQELVNDMDAVIDICSSVLSLRKKYNLRVRQPLATLTVFLPQLGKIQTYENIIASEVNIKKVIFTNQLEAIGSKEVILNFKVLGAIIGKDFKNVVTAVKSGNWKINPAQELLVLDYKISAENYEIRLLPNEGLTGKSLEKNNGMVILDTALTPELIAEGIVRDFVRIVQNARKEANFNISDKIKIAIASGENLESILLAHSSYIQQQTLGVVLEKFTEQFKADFTKTEEIDEQNIQVYLSKV